MAYPDELNSWHGYPGVCQSTQTSVKAVRLSKVDRTVDGNTRVTRPSAYEGVKITVIHNNISTDDKNTIEEYYRSKLNSKFNFLYHGDLSVYIVAFENQPDKTWVSVDSDGNAIWKITSILSGIFSHTESAV